jgi:hypothetical protein
MAMCRYFDEVIEGPHTFDELQKVLYGRVLRPLVRHLVEKVHHENLISGLLYVQDCSLISGSSLGALRFDADRIIELSDGNSAILRMTTTVA